MASSAIHRRVREMVSQKKEKISDEEFFTSQVMCLHFEDLAAAVTRQYSAKSRIKVSIIYRPQSDVTAYTSFGEIVINAASKFVMQGKTREERYKIIFGLFVHEAGHILYTSKLADISFNQWMSQGKWYPEEPEFSSSTFIENKKEIEKMMKNDKKTAKRVLAVCSFLSNIIEDGYIEDRILSVYTGIFSDNLTMVRNMHYDSMPTVSMLIKEEDEGGHIFLSLAQMILSYLKFGRIKYGETSLSDKRILEVFKLLPVLDSALSCHNNKRRTAYTGILLITLWEYIKDFVLSSGFEDEDEKDKKVTQKLDNLDGTSEKMKGDDDALINNAQSKTKSPSDKFRAGTRKDASSCGETSDDFKSVLMRPENYPENEDESLKDETNEATSECPDSASSESIEKLLDKIAERKVHKELEDERIRKLNDFAKSISYGDIHSGINIEVKRSPEVKEAFIDEYNRTAAPLIKISKALQKTVLQKLRDRQKGGKNTGLISGRRIDSRALFRKDGRLFYNRRLPTEAPTLSVGLLLDESGSMHSCSRALYAKATAVIIYDFCTSLGIPIMVYGHSTGYPSNAVELYSYAEFDTIDNRDKYRLMDIKARSCNRDGMALRYVAQCLLKRNEEVKLLILVSDGQPSAAGYYGKPAEDDLKKIQQEYTHKNIILITAAIGEDKEAIQEIYGNSFLDITDLNKLPVSLTNIILRYMKMK